MKLNKLFLLSALTVSTSMAVAQEASFGPVAIVSPITYTELRNPVFEWDSEPGATLYYLYVDDGSGRNPIQKWVSAEEANCTDGGKCYCTLSEWIAGESRWWIMAWMEPNVYSDWSDVGIFTSAITGLYPPLVSELPLAPTPPTER